MKHIKLGVGTYIVREDAAADLSKTLARLARIGYDGVELLGLFGRSAGQVRQLLHDLNLEALGDHVPVAELLADPDRVLRDRQEIGCSFLTLSVGKDDMEAQPFEHLAERCVQAARLCVQAGLTPLYHNHDFDMRGEGPFAERLLDAVQELSFEPDLGWMVVAGQDPAWYLEKYRARIPVVHLKDVFLAGEGGFTFRPTGYGVVNTPALLPAILACDPEWLMVDHDLAYGRDSYDDLRLSYDYVKTLLWVAD